MAAAAALVLTAGSVNAYLSGATEMLRELTAVPSPMSPNEPGRTPRLSSHAFLGFIALAGLVVIGMSALRLADTALLVSVPTTMFLCVYLSCMVSAVRILSAGTRTAAAVAVLAVLAVLAFCGWALLAGVAVAVVAALVGPGSRGYPNGAGKTTIMRLILGLDYSSAGSGSVKRTVTASLPRSSPAPTVRRPGHDVPSASPGTRTSSRPLAARSGPPSATPPARSSRPRWWSSRCPGP